MRAPREPWSDERLAAAFAARAATVGSVPVTLVDDALRDVAAVARKPRGRLPWNVRLAASLAAVVLAATAVGLSRSGVQPSVPGSPAASPAPAGSLVATLSPSASMNRPTTGLQPIIVSEAIRFRDSIGDGRELAVSGFLSPVPGLFCPIADGIANPLIVPCPASFQYVMEKPEVTVTRTTVEPPSGPAFHPAFVTVVPPPVADDPVPVVLVGHFGDRRADLCRSERATNTDAVKGCRMTFVVDQVASINGIPQPVSTFDRSRLFDPAGSPPPTSPISTVDAVVSGASGGQAVLSRTIIPSHAIRELEPSLGRANPLPPGLVWVITTLDDSGGAPVARTWLVVDRTSTLARMTNGNDVSLSLPTSNPGQTILCGRYGIELCRSTIDVARGIYRGEVDAASEIAVDDACPPPAICDRKYPFDAVVGIVPGGTGPGSPFAFEVVGLGDQPERVEPWVGPLPIQIITMLGINHPPIRLQSQSPGAS